MSSWIRIPLALLMVSGVASSAAPGPDRAPQALRFPGPGEAPRGDEPRDDEPPRRNRGQGLTCGNVLCAAEVDAIVGAAATAFDTDTMAVAVVDRVGNVLGLFLEPNATPQSAERAVGLARTAALFSNDRAPLSSRTVRSISGIHFPPGIANTPNAALYGIENTNRGCDLNVAYRSGRAVPPARSAAGIAQGLACDSVDRSGCGLGVVTGKADEFDRDATAVDPGGVPIFRPRAASAAALLGGVGVAGVPGEEAEYAAFVSALAPGTTSPVPEFPLPAPGNVFIDGVRLPFVEQVGRPAGTRPGALAGAYHPAFPPREGRPAPSGFLVDPRAGAALAAADVARIVQQSIDAAGRTRAVIRLPVGFCSRMVIAVADLDGGILAVYRMDDATMFSLDVAVAKARNVVYFTATGDRDPLFPGVSPGTAVTNRTISFGAQPLFPPGIDGTNPGPFFDLFRFDLQNPCSQGGEPAHPDQNGVVFFPGSIPLYKGGRLAGGLGVSGDGVEQDDLVSFLGAAGFQPPEAIWANRVFVPTGFGAPVRLPFLKFPRSPEACRR